MPLERRSLWHWGTFVPYHPLPLPPVPARDYRAQRMVVGVVSGLGLVFITALAVGMFSLAAQPPAVATCYTLNVSALDDALADLERLYQASEREKQTLEAVAAAEDGSGGSVVARILLRQPEYAQGHYWQRDLGPAGAAAGLHPRWLAAHAEAMLAATYPHMGIETDPGHSAMCYDYGGWTLPDDGRCGYLFLPWTKATRLRHVNGPASGARVGTTYRVHWTPEERDAALTRPDAAVPCPLPA